MAAPFKRWIWLAVLVTMAVQAIAAGSCRWYNVFADPQYKVPQFMNATECASIPLSARDRANAIKVCKQCNAHRTKAACLKGVARTLDGSDTFSCAWMEGTAKLRKYTVAVSKGQNTYEGWFDLRKNVCGARFQFTQLSPASVYKVATFGAFGKADDGVSLPEGARPVSSCTVRTGGARSCSFTMLAAKSVGRFQYFERMWTDDKRVIAAIPPNDQCEWPDLNYNTYKDGGRCKPVPTPFKYNMLVTELPCPQKQAPIQSQFDRRLAVTGTSFWLGYPGNPQLYFYRDLTGLSRASWTLETSSTTNLITFALPGTFEGIAKTVCGKGVCDFTAAANRFAIGGRKCTGRKCSLSITKNKNARAVLVVSFPTKYRFNGVFATKVNITETKPTDYKLTFQGYP